MHDYLTQELAYLLQNKEVEINISTNHEIVALPQGLCRIIITNLIRNAFQHTQHGNVSIIQSGKALSIENNNTAKEQSLDDLGFGLGLELTERLIVQYGWYYENIETTTGRKVKIVFD